MNFVLTSSTKGNLASPTTAPSLLMVKMTTMRSDWGRMTEQPVILLAITTGSLSLLMIEITAVILIMKQLHIQGLGGLVAIDLT